MLSYLRNTTKTAITQLLGQDVFVWRLPVQLGNLVSLTFDDGPHPVYTPELLRILAQHGVKATFFLTGENIEKYPQIARDIVEAGHSVGGHTFSHGDITRMAYSELSNELVTTRSLIMDATGTDSILFRPPQGRFNLRTLRTTGALGFTTVHWSVTYSDYLKDGLNPLLERYQRRPIRLRDIVLLHDNNRYTLEILGVVLEGMVGTSLNFISLPQKI